MSADKEELTQLWDVNIEEPIVHHLIYTSTQPWGTYKFRYHNYEMAPLIIQQSYKYYLRAELKPNKVFYIIEYSFSFFDGRPVKQSRHSRLEQYVETKISTPFFNTDICEKDWHITYNI